MNTENISLGLFQNSMHLLKEKKFITYNYHCQMLILFLSFIKFKYLNKLY